MLAKRLYNRLMFCEMLDPEQINSSVVRWIQEGKDRLSVGHKGDKQCLQLFHPWRQTDFRSLA